MEHQVLPDIGISATVFWSGLDTLSEKFSGENRRLLEKRESLQKQIDEWHRANGKGSSASYKAFLQDIGYLLPEGDSFEIETPSTDPEIATIAGPQLVVPSTNARFVLNAANARWGSAYDAFYGTDALGDLPPKGSFNEKRAERVVARVASVLDETFPLERGTHKGATAYRIEDQQLLVDGAALSTPAQCVGYVGEATSPSQVILKNNGLHVILAFDPTSQTGSNSPSGLSDVILESALSAIVDCEDSVACVDAEDKVVAYRNWLGLMKGDLEESFEKAGRSMTRRLNADRVFLAPDGAEQRLKGRSLLLVRNVGHLMTTPTVLNADGTEFFEGLLDALVTTAIAMHDLQKTEGARNSETGSVYVVKPKMHGPEEVAFADAVFAEVERILGLSANTVKLGIMDEERRTSVNLKECIRAAKQRVCFINTGFLDRTGDEIHTSMEAGAFSRKDDIKKKGWIEAYENQNVDIGLECGLSGKAQIGKGMWAVPDNMAAMLDAKGAQPTAGANCAWVPSPTAATLHALHYHDVDVFEVQDELKAEGRRGSVDGLLNIPTADGENWSPKEIQREVENNAQGILGYVVRWIDQGVGCSKVPDINDIGLMEDRATCRISAQHIANWLHHNVVNEAQVLEIFKAMATVVDRQNANDPMYQPMAPNFDAIAFKAACDLVFEGVSQPSGYTEPVLHARRREFKEQASAQ